MLQFGSINITTLLRSIESQTQRINGKVDCVCHEAQKSYFVFKSLQIVN